MRLNLLITLLFISFSIQATTYYVSPTGNDNNTGTSDGSAFKTIQKAADVMMAGDICRIHAGTYRETISPARSGTVGSPISYEPFGDGDVIIDGADPVTGWTLYSGSIYKATMNWDLGAMNQVFVGDAMGQLARWPNVADANNPFNLSNFAYPDAGSALNIIVDNDLPNKPDNYWKDAILWAELGLKWSSFGTRITSSSGKTLNFTGGDDTHRAGRADLLSTDKDLYFLAGKLDFLDAANEWYYDAATQSLYIQVAGGGNPGNTVKAKKRQFAFDLTNASNITIKGVKINASTIRAKDATNCTIDGVTATYITHTSMDGVAPYSARPSFGTGGDGIYISGSNNTVKNCVIRYSAGSGVVIGSGDNHVVDNNDIQYMNYIGNYCEGIARSALYTGATGTNIRITRNKVWYAGGPLITCAMGQEKAINDDYTFVAYNDCAYGELIGDDRGGINGAGAEVAYNWVHDIGVGLAKGTCPGLYTDVSSDFMTFHHNVVWNNQDEFTIRVNNTANDGNGNDGTYLFNNTGYNNKNTTPLSRMDITIESKNNYMNATAANFVNATNGDFRLSASSTVIDQGLEIGGITDGYSGGKPDLGAYEYGGSDAVSNWKAGLNSTIYYSGDMGAVTAVAIKPYPELVLAVNETSTRIWTEFTPFEPVNENVTWASSNTAIALVNVSTTGGITVSGKGVGTCTITVTTQSGNKTASIKVTVYNANVALNKTATASSSYSTTWTPSKSVDGDKSIIAANRWVSGNGTSLPQWLEVNLGAEYYVGGMKFYAGATTSGYNSGLSAFKFQVWDGSSWKDVLSETGSTNARYQKSFPEEKTSKVRLYVTALATEAGNLIRLHELEVLGDNIPSLIPATGVSLNNANGPLYVGETLRMIATLLPSNAGYIALQWTSSNTAIATVTSSGVVAGISEGSATITVSVPNTGINATSIVNVIKKNSGEKINIALNKPVTSNSVYSSFKAENVVNGDKTTKAQRWITEVGVSVAAPKWIEIDLQGEYLVDGMSFWSDKNFDMEWPTEFIFQAWDGIKWVDLCSETANTEIQYNKTFSAVKTSKVRLYVTKAPANTASGQSDRVKLYEIEVYGTLAATTGFDNISDSKRIVQIYPNPLINGYLSIKMNGYTDENLQVSIFDLTGRKVFHTLASASNLDNGILQIDRSVFGKGMYLVKVMDGKANGQVSKIVVE